MVHSRPGQGSNCDAQLRRCTCTVFWATNRADLPATAQSFPLSIEASGRQSQKIQSSPMSTRSTGNLRSSLAPSQHKSRQLAHLHSQLAQLQAHLSDLDNHLRVTSIQAEAIRRLGGLQAGLLYDTDTCGAQSSWSLAWPPAKCSVRKVPVDNSDRERKAK